MNHPVSKDKGNSWAAKMGEKHRAKEFERQKLFMRLATEAEATEIRKAIAEIPGVKTVSEEYHVVFTRIRVEIEDLFDFPKFEEIHKQKEKICEQFPAVRLDIDLSQWYPE